MNEQQLKMIKEFQCPGCTCGPTGENELPDCFKPEPSSLSCSNHSAGTFLGGIGCINLGLPKGFNRLGPIDKKIQRTNIRLQEELPEYNVFNMPLWALEEDGYLFVVVALPRLQQFWVDVIPGKKISDLPPTVLDVSKIDLSECV